MMVVPTFNGLDVYVTFICCTIIIELCDNFYDEAVNNISTDLVWVIYILTTGLFRVAIKLILQPSRDNSVYIKYW
jgi:hypothetical protein